jgi:hypothetical protein
LHALTYFFCEFGLLAAPSWFGALTFVHQSCHYQSSGTVNGSSVLSLNHLVGHATMKKYKLIVAGQITVVFQSRSAWTSPDSVRFRNAGKKGGNVSVGSLRRALSHLRRLCSGKMLTFST